MWDRKDLIKIKKIKSKKKFYNNKICNECIL